MLFIISLINWRLYHVEICLLRTYTGIFVLFVASLITYYWVSNKIDFLLRACIVNDDLLSLTHFYFLFFQLILVLTIIFFKFALLAKTCPSSILENIWENRWLARNLAFSILIISLISSSNFMRLPGRTKLTLPFSWKRLHITKTAQKHIVYNIFLWQTE